MKLEISYIMRTFACAYDHLANTRLTEEVGLWLDRHASQTQTDELAETVELVKRVKDALPGTRRAADLANWLNWHDRPETPAQDADEVTRRLFQAVGSWIGGIEEDDLSDYHLAARQAMLAALWFGHD